MYRMHFSNFFKGEAKFFTIETKTNLDTLKETARLLWGNYTGPKKVIFYKLELDKEIELERHQTWG